MNEKPMVHVHLRQPNDVKVSDDGSTCVSQQIKHMVQWVHRRIDEDLIHSICEIARAEGVTDVTILDKEFIVSAIRRSMREKPSLIDMGDGFNCSEVCCPNCGESVINYWNKKINPPHCMMCGQALDWSEN